MASEQELREYLRKAIVALDEAKRRLRAALETHREPIAIVSMACRLPERVNTPEALWEVLVSGQTSFSMPPAHRKWDVAALSDSDPDRAGKTYSLMGGYLHDADAFDARFFDLSAYEATTMDPQQRLLLEVSWEALERAGFTPAFLDGVQAPRTGVFVGVMANGYGGRIHPNLEAHDRTLSLGSAPSVASSRIAYALGLKGPGLSVDTACSSSLVALHLACQALRARECDLALAGGATVMVSPHVFLETSRQRGLAPDGQCKPFSEAANGVGWAEGAGMLLLERLSDARRLGHPVVAVIRGSAVNQDGRGQGIASPNGPAQQTVIQEALRAAGVVGSDVDAVEAHGTGTPLGDAIEAQAILATYGLSRRREQPLWLGNLKANVGHTQAAAGVIGVIKTVLSMQHGLIPAMPSARAPMAQATKPGPNPDVDWTAGHVCLLDEATPWQTPGGRPRRAGVSAFGVGTNAHLIVEECSPPHKGPEASPTLTEGAVAFVVSGKTEASLRSQAAQLAEHLERFPDLRIQDVASTLAHHRVHFAFRAGAVVTSLGEAISWLRLLGAGDADAGVAINQGGRAPGAASDGSLERALEEHLRGGSVDWSRWLPLSAARVVLPTYAFQRERYWLDAPTVSASALPATHLGAPALSSGPPPRSAKERERYFIDLVRQEVAVVLGVGVTEVSVDTPLFQIGFDSLRATGLRIRLNARTGMKLPATLVFKRPTVLAIAELLAADFAEGLSGAPAPDLRITAAEALIPNDEGPTQSSETAYEEFDL